jgi:uncharacterized membrane protein YkoI
MRLLKLSRVLLTAMVLATAVPAITSMAHAQSLIDPRQRNNEPNVDPIRISMDQAVRMAESRYRAKAVKADTVRSGDRVVYQIRLLSEGKVWTVRVDAQSGQMN